MKFDYLSKRLGGFALAFFVLFALATVGASNAQGQWRRDDRRDDRRNDRNYNNGFQIARQQGYSYGLSTGSADAQRGQSFSPQRSRYWRNATEGYRSSYGNKGQYKQIFRDAFAQGYREGYQRYGYGNNRRSNNNGRWVNGVWRRN